MKNNYRLVAFILSLSLLIGTLTLPTVAQATLKGADEIPYTEHNTSIAAQNYDSTLTVYNESEAKDAGVPDGYSGYVIKVKGKTDSAYGGLCLDFSDQKIKADAVESITMRIYLPAGNSEMRIRNEASTAEWVMRQVPTQFDAWVDISLHSEGTGFYASSGMKNITNPDGNLGSFCLIGRFKGSNPYYYIDSVTVRYKEGASGDTTPPVISYNGPTELSAIAGEVFALSGISAYDEFDGKSIPLSYEWEAGAVNSKGELNEGEFTCTVKATDRSGNTTSITVTVNAKADRSRVSIDTIPYISGGFKHGDGNTYAGTVTRYTTENLPAGAPTDFAGGITEIRSSSNRFGIYFDPSELEIPIDLIESITVRIYLLEAGSNVFRMAFPGANDWLVLHNPGNKGWCEYTIYADGRGFTNGNLPKISNLANSDGNLGAFGIAVKYPTSSTEDICYIDGIIVSLKKDDCIAPEINYDGETSIFTSMGKPFALDISAYDVAEEREIPLVYEWSDGAIDDSGLLRKGEHTVRISATDHYGNENSITISVNVGDPDVTAPSIEITVSEVYALAGSLYRFNITAIDDYDKVTVNETWSDEAIDMYGVLQSGEHTLTLTVTDLSGNSTTHIINFHVVDVIENEFIIE